MRMSVGRTRLLGWALALLAIVAFASLGRWQLGRMGEKQAMLDAVAATLAERDAVPLSAAADPARARDYDWSAGDGRFVPGPALLLDNQQRNGRPGVRVYRLFQPDAGAAGAHGGMPLLVELGWLPLPPTRTMPRIAPIDGPLRVAGLLVPPPSSGLAAPTGSGTAHGDRLVTSLDAAWLQATLGVDGLSMRVLKLDPALPLGYPRDLDILPNTLPPEKHLGYAVQWFGLALAVLVTALILTFRTRRR